MDTTNYSTLWWLVGYLVLCTTTSAFADYQLQHADLDTEVIDAAPRTRSARQLYYTAEGRPPVVQSAWMLREGNTCVTSKGHIGTCTTYRSCYPFFKIADLTIWESWILGNYDTCSFFNDDGRQTFGVCCSNPITVGDDRQPLGSAVSASSSTTTTTTTSTTSAPKSEPSVDPAPSAVAAAESASKDNNYPNWPPPIPTHPPDHAAPTHPPSLVAGGGSGSGASKPTASTARPAATTWPTKAPTTTTTAAHWPPAVPTHGPAAGPAGVTTEAATDNDVAGQYSTCGSKNGNPDQERIVGGQNADPNEWPWVVVIFNNGRQLCGGSLIDESHILTAAHCVAHMTPWDVARLTVRLGDHNIKLNNEVKHVERRIKRLVRHRGFDMRTLYNDVAVLTMDQAVEFTRTVRAICLPQANSRLYSGHTGTVIGWGSLRENGPTPSVLQEVTIPIWGNNDCRGKYGPAAPGGIIESMLCAGQATKDSCSGDSGGPLMVPDGNQWVQVGIVSWGIGCGKGQYPGVYTRVTHFMPWITKNIRDKKL